MLATHPQASEYVRACVCACVHACMYACARGFISLWIHICVRASVCTCVSVCACMHAYEMTAHVPNDSMVWRMRRCLSVYMLNVPDSNLRKTPFPFIVLPHKLNTHSQLCLCLAIRHICCSTASEKILDDYE